VATLLRTPPAARPPGALTEPVGALLALRPLLQAAIRAAPKGPGPLAPLRNALRRWQGIAAALHAAAAEVPVPLHQPRPAGTEAAAELAIMDAAFVQLDRAFADADQAPEARDAGAFADIRYRPSAFLVHAHVAWRLLAGQGRVGSARFLDVGCGAGSKVAMAAQLFAAADGIELDPGYAAAARRLLRPHLVPRTTLIEGDARTFRGFGAYDAVYFYAPMRIGTALRALEDAIVAGVRPGTVLIGPYDEFHERSPALGVQPVTGAVGIAGVSAAEAASWVAAAERTGPLIPAPGRLRERPEDGLWAGILNGLRLNGRAE
jgi:SAM-dependent methyltransferase